MKRSSKDSQSGWVAPSLLSQWGEVTGQPQQRHSAQKSRSRDIDINHLLSLRDTSNRVKALMPNNLVAIMSRKGKYYVFGEDASDVLQLMGISMRMLNIDGVQIDFMELTEKEYFHLGSIMYELNKNLFVAKEL